MSPTHPTTTIKSHPTPKKLLSNLTLKHSQLQEKFHILEHENEALRRQVEVQDAALKLAQKERESPMTAWRNDRSDLAQQQRRNTGATLGFEGLMVNSTEEFHDYFKEDTRVPPVQRGTSSSSTSHISTNQTSRASSTQRQSAVSVSSPTESPDYLSLNSPISSSQMLRKMAKTRDYGNLVPIPNVKNIVCNYMFDLFVNGDEYRAFQEEERSSLGELYKFRSLQQKAHLLDDALNNSILCMDTSTDSGLGMCPDLSSTMIILLHIKESLSPDLFLRCILAPRPAAQDIYLAYLHRTGSTKEAENLYRVLGRIQEYGMILVEKALRSSHPGSISQKELDALDRAIELCSKYQELEFETNQLIQRRNLLQRELKVSDSQLAASVSKSITNVLDASPTNGIPRPSVANVSIRDFVHYCLLFHAKAPPGRASSPLAAKKYFGISEKLHTYLRLLSVSQKEQWHEVQDLLPLSGLISKRPNSALNLYTYLQVCHEHHAPVEIMEYFASFVQPDRLRLDIAKRFHLYELCIALCQKMKFKEELLHIQAFIKQSNAVIKKEELDQQIEDTLQDAKIRWVPGGKGQKDFDTKSLFS